MGLSIIAPDGGTSGWTGLDDGVGLPVEAAGGADFALVG
jgi:hypothetical protein